MATVTQQRPLRRGAMNQQGALYDFLWNVKEVINTLLPNAGLSLEAGASAPSLGSSLVLSGITGNTAAIRSYQATVTVLNGATTGKEAAIAMPANFLPICMLIHCTVAATNACSLVDVGDDADTDSYCDGIVTNDLTSTGFKGIVGCNGVRALGDITGGVQVATTTADEVEIVVSADPGATGVTVRLTFIGVLAS